MSTMKSVRIYSCVKVYRWWWMQLNNIGSDPCGSVRLMDHPEAKHCTTVPKWSSPESWIKRKGVCLWLAHRHKCNKPKGFLFYHVLFQTESMRYRSALDLCDQETLGGWVTIYNGDCTDTLVSSALVEAVHNTSLNSESYRWTELIWSKSHNSTKC